MVAKTDKELAVEIVCAFIQTWNDRASSRALQAKDVIDLLEGVYSALQSLPNKDL
jgi:hypothetical protein